MVRRNTDDADDGAAMRLNGNTPWYVKAISLVGVPAAIAFYLIYYLTTTAPTKAEMITIGDSLKVHVSSTQSDLTDIKRILLASCVNAGHTDVERLKCLGQVPVASGQ